MNQQCMSERVKISQLMNQKYIFACGTTIKLALPRGVHIKSAIHSVASYVDEMMHCTISARHSLLDVYIDCQMSN